MNVLGYRMNVLGALRMMNGRRVDGHYRLSSGHPQTHFQTNASNPKVAIDIVVRMRLNAGSLSRWYRHENVVERMSASRDTKPASKQQRGEIDAGTKAKQKTGPLERVAERGDEMKTANH